MRKLLELLAKPEQAGDFGIEIEVEGDNLVPLNDMYWRSERDGSLRGGLEYIFVKPVGLKHVPALLKHLVKHFDANKSKLDFSFRTSVHVHLNMQHYTYDQLLNTIYTYILLEEPLMNFCGEDRKANRFCLRLADAEGAMEVFTMLFSNGEQSIFKIPADKMRYAAINIESLNKYGSLEFRAMQGNLDVERITTWCKCIEKIRAFACKFESPSEIYNFYVEKEAEQFFNEVLQEVAPKFTGEDLARSIRQSFSLSIDLPFVYLNSRKKVEASKLKGAGAPPMPGAVKWDELVAGAGEFNARMIRPAPMRVEIARPGLWIVDDIEQGAA